MTLDHLIDAFDLPAWIEQEYPDSGARAGTEASIKAVWRGESSGSLHLHHHEQRWLYKDFATGEGGNAYTFLTKIQQRPAKEALAILEDQTGLKLSTGVKTSRPAARPAPWSPKSSPRIPVKDVIVKGHVKKVLELKSVPAAVVPKGLALRDCLKYQIISTKRGDAVFPIIGPDGEVISLKIRLLESDDGQRYRYAVRGHGSPAWCSPNIRDKREIIIVEGELNAICLDIAMGQQIGVMGVSGKNGHLHLDVLHGKTVYVYSDPDDKDGAARKRWARSAVWAGAADVLILQPEHKDAADLHKEGADVLRDAWRDKIESATPYQDEPEPAPATQVAAAGIYIHDSGYRKGDIQLTNWLYEPFLRLKNPDGTAGERGMLIVNGVEHQVDIPASAWNTPTALLDIIGNYGAVFFSVTSGALGRIRQHLLIHYNDLPTAKGVTSYGLHQAGEDWVSLYQDQCVGEFDLPPIFYAGTKADPKSVSLKTPPNATQELTQAARASICQLHQLVTASAAMAVTGYALASAFTPRIIPSLGFKLPFLYIAGEREAGKSSLAEAALELATGDRSARLAKAASMSNYQYDIAVSNANNLLTVLDEYKPGLIDDSQLRKHYDLGTKWRGTGRLGSDLAYHLNAPTIVMGEGFTDDPATLSRGALYFVEKHDRGTITQYNQFTQAPLWAYAAHLHRQAREQTQQQISERITKARALVAEVAKQANPRLAYALTFIAFGLLIAQEDITPDLYQDRTIIQTLQWGITHTLEGGQESQTNFERWLEQLGAALVEHKAPDSVIEPGAVLGELVIGISAAVEAVAKRYGKDSAIANARLLRRYSRGHAFVIDGEVWKTANGNQKRGIKINLQAENIKCDLSQLEYLENKMRPWGSA